MSHVTTHLEDESGIQYGGVEDKTNLQQIGDMSNMLMLVEDVPRGRLDQAMTITKANLSAFLGREKGNLYLQAVEDALEAGAPSVQVMRVSNSNQVIEITCADAPVSMQMSNYIFIEGSRYNNDKIKFSISVNGVLYNKDKSLNLYNITELSDLFSFAMDSSGTWYISALQVGEYKIILSPSADQKIYAHSIESRGTAGFIDEKGDIYFCLSK